MPGNLEAPPSYRTDVRVSRRKPLSCNEFRHHGRPESRSVPPGHVCRRTVMAHYPGRDDERRATACVVPGRAAGGDPAPGRERVCLVPPDGCRARRSAGRSDAHAGNHGACRSEAQGRPLLDRERGDRLRPLQSCQAASLAGGLARRVRTARAEPESCRDRGVTCGARCGDRDERWPAAGPRLSRRSVATRGAGGR